MALFLRRLHHKPEKVLVARTDRIGDFVLTLPVLEVMSRAGLRPSVLCRSAVMPLLENNPFVDTVIAVDDEAVDPIDAIRSCSFDCLLVLVNDPIIRDLLPQLRHIPVRIGPLSKPSVFLSYTHPVVQKRSRSLMNEAAYNLELLQQLGLNTDNPPRPRLYFSPEEIRGFRAEHEILFAGESTAPRIVFHQGMGGSALNWPASHYQSLLKGLLEGGYCIFLTGIGDEEAGRNRKHMDALQADFSMSLFDLSNRLSLRQLGLLIHLSDLFVGPSTGPTHLASAVGTEIVAFYPPIQVQSTTRWGPFLSSAALFTPDVSCGQKFRCIDEKCPDFFCMERIQPEAVLRYIQELLPAGSI